ncbi:AaceriAFL054Cp [[Ashbya] aceris (nom. inval.)]|nr:AaceriAFL054Cp [[Ashbya] aceris (nom. inval.)]
MSSGACRGRSFRSEADMGGHGGHGGAAAGHGGGKTRGKKLKQFSTRSRSKSNANFKGLVSLHRTSSHDGTYSRGDGEPSNGSMKRTRSYDSLSKRKALSMLSMTALGRTEAASSGDGRAGRGAHGRPVLQLHETEQGESSADEEVDYFSGEDLEDGAQWGAGDEEFEGDEGTGEVAKAAPPLPALPAAAAQRGGSPQGLARMQLSYKAPSSLRNKLIDSNDEDDRIEHSKDYGHGYGDANGAGKALHAEETIAESAHSLQRHGTSTVDGRTQYSATPRRIDGPEQEGRTGRTERTPETETPGAVEAAEHPDDAGDADKPATGGQAGHINGEADKDSDHYAPDMILSQSTGVERHFNQTLSRQNSVASHAAMIDNSAYDTQHPNQNRFNYINNELASSLKSGELKAEEKPSKDFSTSISSLTSHLQGRAPNSRSGNRANNLMALRTSQTTLLRGQQVSFLGEHGLNQGQQRTGAQVPLNHFSQFLQSNDQNNESRTQQKLWLQRESSFLDVSAHSATGSDALFLASNVEVRREFERISREYMSVRRFGNPLNDAITRVVTQHKIDVKKHNKSSSPMYDASNGSLFGSYQRNMKTFGELHPDIRNREMEIQQVLNSLWNEGTTEFSKDTNPLSQKGPYLQQNPKVAAAPRSRTTGPTPHHNQRLINSLQPTTRAFNRRMETALNQQRL